MAKKTIQIDGRTYDIRPEAPESAGATMTLPRIPTGITLKILFVCVILLGLAARNFGLLGETNSTNGTLPQTASMANIPTALAEIIPTRGGAIEHTHEANALAGFAQRMNSPLEGVQILTTDGGKRHFGRLIFIVEGVSVTDVNKKCENRIRKFPK